MLCHSCSDEAKREERAWREALDVEDAVPPEGMVFLVSGATNVDSQHDWHEKYVSFRAATAALRAARLMAERYGGIYPRENDRVQTVPASSFRPRRKWWEEEEEEPKPKEEEYEDGFDNFVDEYEDGFDDFVDE